MSELYSRSGSRRARVEVLTTPALDATVSTGGDQILYHDYQGLRERLAKAPHVGRDARHLGVRLERRRATRSLTTFDGEDRNPVFDADDDDFYYL